MYRNLLILSLAALSMTAQAKKRHTPPPLLPPKPVERIPTHPQQEIKIRRNPLPLQTVPETVGIELDAAAATPVALDAAERLGLRWVKLSLDWPRIESQPGTYDFSPYDALLTEIQRRRLTPVVSLPLSHPRFEGRASSTPDGRAAFTAFARQAALHYRGKVKFWILGEDTSSGASTTPGADYALLASDAGRAINQSYSQTVLIAAGPGDGDPLFYQRAFSGGLADLVDAILIEPRANGAPEDLKDPYSRLNVFITGLKVPHTISLLAGGTAAPEAQENPAAWTLRRILFNYGQLIPVTFWNPAGMSLAPAAGGSVGGANETESTLRALEFMNRYLAGAKLKRVRELPAGLHGLVLTGRGKEINVLWSSRGPAPMKVRARRGSLPAYNLYGEAQPAITAEEKDLQITESPLYIEGRLIVNGS